MISYLDSRIMDINSEALGVNVGTLMGNAGKAVADVVKERFKGKKIAIVCGNGNNGGDGIAAANHLKSENVTVLLLRPIKDIHSDNTVKTLSSLSCPVEKFVDLTGFDIAIDCALGTGIKNSVKPPYRRFIEIINNFEGVVVSIDVPSGLGTETAVQPDITITFHDIKEGMTRENSGEIIVKDIGIPSESTNSTGPGDMLRYPLPAENSHKGYNGKLLIIGGGCYFGAPALAALAAMRTGADLVHICTPASCHDIIASYSPTFVMTELDGNILTKTHIPALLKLCKINDAVVIGPGLGTDPKTAEAVRSFVSECKIPIVVDADGLNALGKNFCNSNNTSVVLTPHAGEFERLGGTDVPEYAAKTNTVVVLKGPTDMISDGSKVKINKTGTPAMTCGGTGDVLAGIIGALLSKKLSAYDAACLGTYMSGKSGELAFEKYSYGLMATDIIDNIPEVLKRKTW